MRRTAAIWVSALLGFTVAICEVAAAPPDSALPGGNTLPSLNLSEPFGAHPGWRFSASQGPDIADPLGDAADRVPGAIRLCVSPDGGRTCRPSLDGVLAGPTGSDMFSQPHFLDYARIVHPRSDLPLLLIAVASLHSGDGDQRVATVALGYDRAHDTFVPAYRNRTGRNRNEETRYVATGALRGAIIAVEPTPNAPFGFWVTVAKTGAGNRYRQVLRYRSATIYNDGNPLAVIDSEMPNIQQRLGLWHAGSPVPLPAASCPRPRLIKRELWCSDRPPVR